MTRHSERQGEPGGWKAGWSGLEGQHQGYRSQKGRGLNRDLRENQALTSPKSRRQVLQAEETVCKSLGMKRRGNGEGSTWLPVKKYSRNSNKTSHDSYSETKAVPMAHFYAGQGMWPRPGAELDASAGSVITQCTEWAVEARKTSACRPSAPPWSCPQGPERGPPPRPQSRTRASLESRGSQTGEKPGGRGLLSTRTWISVTTFSCGF